MAWVIRLTRPRGRAPVLLRVFKIPVLVFRGEHALLVSGPVGRWTVIAALIARGLGRILRFAMHDAILRAQGRFVPVGAWVGVGLGWWRRAAQRKRPDKL